MNKWHTCPNPDFRSATSVLCARKRYANKEGAGAAFQLHRLGVPIIAKPGMVVRSDFSWRRAAVKRLVRADDGIACNYNPLHFRPQRQSSYATLTSFTLMRFKTSTF